MDRASLAQGLIDLTNQYLKDKGIELVELTTRYEGPNLYVRIFADRPEGGITLEECASLNCKLSSLFEENILIEERYTLEVSSPGIDRSLSTKNDFLRSLDKTVRFFLNTLVNGKLEWEGVVKKADDDSVYIEVKGELLQVPYLTINKAKRKT